LKLNFCWATFEFHLIIWFLSKNLYRQNCLCVHIEWKKKKPVWTRVSHDQGRDQNLLVAILVVNWSRPNPRPKKTKLVRQLDYLWSWKVVTELTELIFGLWSLNIGRGKTLQSQDLCFWSLVMVWSRPIGRDQSNFLVVIGVVTNWSLGDSEPNILKMIWFKPTKYKTYF